MGKGKNPAAEQQEHRSRPLASLKDPDAFGPPPKNSNYHGGGATSGIIAPDRNGVAAPVSGDEIQAQEEDEQREIDAAEKSAPRKPAAPLIPYRADTTGLPTRNLPKPSLRQNEHGSLQNQSPPNLRTKPKPSLPPRLPPRQNSSSSPSFQGPFSPPPPYSAAATATPNVAQNEVTTQGALRRLASAGVKVPALSIGGGTDANSRPALAKPDGSDITSTPSAGQGSQPNELLSRFSKMSAKPSSVGSPSHGTSFAQKQAAFKTASSFQKTPSSVSLADARATASTVNNFRERHGDQVATGWKSANALNQKYDLSSKVAGYASNSDVSNPNESTPSAGTPGTSDAVVHMMKKRAPPPPPKKVFTGGDSAGSPPPIPLSSKPKQ